MPSLTSPNSVFKIIIAITLSTRSISPGWLSTWRKRTLKNNRFYLKFISEILRHQICPIVLMSIWLRMSFWNWPRSPIECLASTSMKKIGSSVLKNIKTVWFSPLITVPLSVFFGISLVSSIWEGGRVDNPGKARRMEKESR